MAVVVSFAPGPEGEQAVQEAKDQAARLGWPLVAVCTLPTDEARRGLRALAGPDAIYVDNQDGDDAVEVILEAIDRYDAQLLVIGLRRRTPVGKLILGSSAQRLLLDAKCPVLAVKP